MLSPFTRPLGQRITAVPALVGERHDLARLLPVEHNRAIQQSAAERLFADLVTDGRYVPAVPGVVRDHRSTTNRSDSDRDTQIIM